MTNPVKWRFAPLPEDQLHRIYMIFTVNMTFRAKAGVRE
jgi:hypothetical protein